VAVVVADTVVVVAVMLTTIPATVAVAAVPSSTRLLYRLERNSPAFKAVTVRLLSSPLLEKH
ncbi:MAG: hypothetical protein WCS99_08040, partial [Limisphaerales bacterium]